MKTKELTIKESGSISEGTIIENTVCISTETIIEAYEVIGRDDDWGLL